VHSAAGLVAWLDIAFICCRRLERASLSATEASPPGIASTGMPPLPPMLDSPPDAQQPAGYSNGHQTLAAPATPSPYEMARSGPDRHISCLSIPSKIHQLHRSACTGCALLHSCLLGHAVKAQACTLQAAQLQGIWRRLCC
jgi:hypothetical protein